MNQLGRYQLLENWIKGKFPTRPFLLSPASNDASFRRYFRVTFSEKSAHKALIVMDAPPQHEDCVPFLHVANIFSAAKVHVPEVLAQDLEQGFLLLSDLESTTYLEAISANPLIADRLYRDAVDALIRIQLVSRSGVLPDYDETLLLKELNLFPDWYLAKHLQIALNVKQKRELDEGFTKILQNNLAQPRVFVHRDYHSRNLMVTTPNPGIVDFQDAVYGPITYDLVSLFKDAYIYWDEERILDWIIRYWEKARKTGLPVAENFSDFYRDFEWMGVQRHIKVLGIFARLCYRDGKNNYLKDVPPVINYLRKTCERYHELNFMLVLLDELESKRQEIEAGHDS
ncbi:MAG: aminoglycoside phosphotransferase [Nitrosomonadales bacterium]|nr:MAG: aminoglycoside phosphotransferase [Nitrosomonadales bacterium]